jgi:hypothetical protein
VLHASGVGSGLALRYLRAPLARRVACGVGAGLGAAGLLLLAV